MNNNMEWLRHEYAQYLKENKEQPSPEQASYFANYLAQRGGLRGYGEKALIVELEGRLPANYGHD